MRVDIVRELINRILEASHREGSFTESMALEIERQFRFEYNGAECVISAETKGPKADPKAVTDAYLKGHPVEQIAKENGISRATLYRYLKR